MTKANLEATRFAVQISCVPKGTGEKTTDIDTQKRVAELRQRNKPDFCSPRHDTATDPRTNGNVDLFIRHEIHGAKSIFGIL